MRCSFTHNIFLWWFFLNYLAWFWLNESNVTVWCRLDSFRPWFWPVLHLASLHFLTTSVNRTFLRFVNRLQLHCFVNRVFFWSVNHIFRFCSKLDFFLFIIIWCRCHGHLKLLKNNTLEVKVDYFGRQVVLFSPILINERYTSEFKC